MEKAAITTLLQDFSIETTPRAFEQLEPLVQYLPLGARVFVTFLPSARFSDTIQTAEKIAAQGFRPVVHVAARNLQSTQELQEGLAQLQASGIRDLLLLAGSMIHSQSPYPNALTILDSGVLEQFSWNSIGFAGHPEGHPDVNAEQLMQAAQHKWQYAQNYPREYYLTTQFCFTAEPVIAWRQALLAAGIHFPVRIGVAGLASTAALIRHAKLCGVGASMNFLIKNMGTFRHLLGGIEAPSRLLMDLAQALMNQTIGSRIALHFFPLGDFTRTTAWLSAIQAGRFFIDDKRGVIVEN